MTTTTRLQLHLHTLIDTSQKQHGILQNNYTNYRQACTRKLDRLRHGKEYRRLLIQHAKAAAAEVEKEEEQKESICKPVEHINTLMICLFQAERAWSYSMELKAEYDAKTVGTTVAFSDGFKKNSSAGSVRNHFLRRLRKAVKYAEELEFLCKALADDVSIAEASIYCCWMRAGLALEVKNWRTACKDYGKALAICRTFASSEGALSTFELDLFESRAEFIIEPVLKYCQYELKVRGSNENELEQQLIDQQNRANEELYPILNAKINVENGQSEESNRDVGINSIEFRGRTLPVSNASLRNALCKINEAVESISNATNPDEDQFETLFDVHNSAIQIIENDIQKLDNMNKAAQVGSRKQEQESLLAYVRNSKLTHALQKGEAEALKLRESSCSINDDDQIKYFEDLSHIYDSLVRQAKEKSELPGGDDDEFAAAADAHVLRLDAQRCYYIGNIYAAKGKFVEARKVFDHAISLTTQAADELNASDAEDAYVDSMIQLEQDLTGAKCRAQANAYLLSRYGARKENKSLLERVNSFDAGSADNPLLSHVPPSFTPIIIKPSFHDICRSIIEDDIKKTAAEVEANKRGKGLLGWFRG